MRGCVMAAITRRHFFWRQAVGLHLAVDGLAHH